MMPPNQVAPRWMSCDEPGLTPFVSPASGLPLQQDQGVLKSAVGESFPVVGGIARFEVAGSYADAFGLEWNTHQRIQLDSYTGTNRSQVRLERCLGGPVENLRGKSVLEAGCGAGRFTEILVRAGALVHAIDLSSAVEANHRNIGQADNYRIAQASILKPPFESESFDLVICLGVLQHLPSPEVGIRALWRMVKPSGCLAIDHYLRSGLWGSVPTTLRPLYRSLLKRLPPRASKAVSDFLVRLLLPAHRLVRGHRVLEFPLNRISPLMGMYYLDEYPQLTSQELFELCCLDTYDGLTDWYKHHRVPEEIEDCLESLDGSQDVRVWIGGNGIEARTRKSSASDSGTY